MTANYPTFQEVQVIRLLKRQAIVLLLMLRYDRPWGETDIARVLDINNETARNYLRSLADIGLITRSSYHRGWILTTNGRQLILPLAEFPRVGPADSASLLADSATSTTLNNDYIPIVEEEVVVEEPAEFPRVDLDSIRKALAYQGISWTPRVAQICKYPWVTAEYISSQAQRLRKEGRFSTGLLLRVIQDNDPLPSNRYRDYLSGEFSEFIER